MIEPLIGIRGIKKAYKGRTVLDIPDLNLEHGRVYALVGTNGSGKSTLLRLLAGIIQPTQGEITLAGLDHIQDIAYLPQKPYAFSFSVLKNIIMAISEDISSGEKAELATAVLTEVGIDSLASAKGNRLSGGETQRLSLARLLVQSHKLLLLDEPTSATDIAGNQRIEDAICRYREKTGCDLIFATHALSQAERLADDIVFLSAGEIVEQGPAKQVLQNPQTPQCRDFLRFWQY
jgi:tungstate transport system ATP-binding protein